MLWSKIRQAVTVKRVVYVGIMLVTAAVFFAIGYTTPKYPNMKTPLIANTSDESVVSLRSTTSSTTASTDTQGVGEITTTSDEQMGTTTQMPINKTTTSTTKTTASTVQPHPSGKIPINSATKDQLMSVPGIGEVFAQRIIDYRTANNGFVDIAELKNIKGIGDTRYEKWKDYFVVD